MNDTTVGPTDLSATLTIGTVQIPITLTVSAALGLAEALTVETGAATPAIPATPATTPATAPAPAPARQAGGLEGVRAEIAAIRAMSRNEAEAAVAPLVNGNFTYEAGLEVSNNVLSLVEQAVNRGGGVLQSYISNPDGFARTFCGLTAVNDIAVAGYIHGRLAAAYRR